MIATFLSEVDQAYSHMDAGQNNFIFQQNQLLYETPAGEVCNKTDMMLYH